MSQALALKYRPKRFEDLIGQDSISQTLAQALDQNRLGHAYLFSGLRGSGKTSTARIFSKALLCEKGPTSKPCDVCEQCQMANEGRHIDIIEMDAASSRKIDDIRDLIEHTKYKPSVGRFKIFIIDEVHMLTKEAFNALLKTLEEPPEFVKFILATTDPLKLPATILSRTQHFRFKKIAKPLIIKHLEHILNIENIAYEPEALGILARSGSGSLRDTLTLLDQAIVYSKSHVDVATVTQMLGIVDPDFLEKLFDAVLQKNDKKIREYLVDLENYEAEMVIDEMSLFLKDKLLQNDPKFSPVILERFYRILADAKPLLALNTDGDFVLSLTIFKMVEAMNIKQIDEMIEELEKELSTTNPLPVKTNTPSNIKHQTSNIKNQISNTQHPPSAPIEPDNSILFKKLIQLIYDRNYELGKAFDESIEFVDFKDGVLSWVSNAEGKNRELLKNNFGVVRHLVQEVFGIGTKISLVKSDNPPKQKTEEPKPEAPQKEPTPNKQEPLQSKDEQPQSENQDANGTTDTSGMVEDVDFNNASCVTGNCSAEDPSKEIDVKDILNDPMVKKAQELFNAKKIVIRPKV
ncbi:DNA polymerase III subunit gamma/tau [Hydrogenimonas thermophila]|uniref:DNA polymerase III subunit gamma/tau n=1 Tax=Hydrogenimonas thermophila TaxID=223786 RepID=UPI0029370BDD|nr:DNA polymerase III subunit gamma/tau [Hydrogenimonas thermophila]WOE70333.1 DNA polymerase III subunit gamma/tau [Hydrogenimonas thermophila]WOE72850.1 DNA polymerase III subunit gamma/tau [Hydrogenimonas thermophila]